MPKSDSDSVSILIEESLKLVKEKAEIQTKMKDKTQDELLLDLLLNDNQSDINKNRENIEKLQGDIENDKELKLKRIKEIENKVLLNKKEIRILIKKRIRSLDTKLKSAMNDNNSNEISKYIEILDKNITSYNNILNLLHSKPVHMKTLYDSSGGGKLI